MTAADPPRTGAGVVGRPPATAPGAGTFSAEDDTLTRVYRDLLAANPTPPGGALLFQTVAIAPLRRTFLPLVPLRPGWEVLDLGTGFGPVAFELAHREAVGVTGVDRDPAVLAATRRLVGPLQGWLRPGSRVEVAEASAEDLPLEDARFDLVTAVLLLQHVRDPAAVVGEMWRVLRPGGVAFAFDVDDGLGATFPEEGPLTRLEDAFDAQQASYGGDRRIGRKLSVLFAEAGFAAPQLTVLSQAQHVETRPGTELRSVTAARLRAARTGIVEGGFLDARTFDDLVGEYEAGPARSMCRIEGRVALVAVKPGDRPVGHPGR